MRRSGPIGLFPLAANLKSRRGGFDYTGLFSMIFAGGESFFPTVKIIYKLFRGRVERLRRTRRKSRFCCAAKVLLVLVSHHLILTPLGLGLFKVEWQNKIVRSSASRDVILSDN